jgi:hypothetical protein
MSDLTSIILQHVIPGLRNGTRNPEAAFERLSGFQVLPRRAALE